MVPTHCLMNVIIMTNLLLIREIMGHPITNLEPKVRKFGDHHKNAPSQSPYTAPESPTAETEMTSWDKTTLGAPKSSMDHSSSEAVHLKKEIHHPFDKSVAGGGVIIGGLATTFLVAVISYIRATKKNVQQLQSKV
ncbi:hypothetical protein RND81_13G083800 [Saponaria officinalis]|uniref:Uncharacterized protein n=1 Tax=Saponaria officinalis TaxID=3572 RepID=A0AAW1H524_SAPOF